jgi:hypothetical protein
MILVASFEYKVGSGLCLFPKMEDLAFECLVLNMAIEQFLSSNNVAVFIF